tara:strand:+ start:23151 stop:25157 length:2007 start_codon:yes stop_codon:yes gene_type:complete
MATIDEILRRTAYKRPYMKNYKPMFGTSSGGTGRFGGSNFASSTLGYSNTPNGERFKPTEKFFSAFTPGIAYDSFEEALAVGKEARDTQDLEDYKSYANSFGVSPSAEGFDAYRKEKGAERQQEQAQSQKNAAVARQIFEKERALRIAERDKAIALQQDRAKQMQLEAYRRASIAQKRRAAQMTDMRSRREAARTAQNNRMKQLMDNAAKGYYSDMSRDQFANMINQAGVDNPLDVTQAVGGFDAFNTKAQEDQARIDQSLREDQVKAAEGIIKNNPRSLYTFAKEPENISQLTMQDKYRLNELMRNENLEIERTNQASAMAEESWNNRVDFLANEVRTDSEFKDKPEEVIQEEISRRKESDLGNAEGEDLTLGKLLKIYEGRITGDLINNPIFPKATAEPSPFLFPTKGVVDGYFTGTVDEATGQVYPLEPGDFSDDPNYYYGDTPAGVSSDTEVSPMTPTPEPDTPEPDTPTPLTDDGPAPLPDEMVGSTVGDNEMVTEVQERLAQGQTPEEIMGTPPTIQGDEGLFDPSGNFFQRGGTTIEGSNLHQGSKAWTNFGGMAAGIGKLPVAMLAGAAEIPVNAYRTATGSAPTGPLFSRDVKSIPMLDPKEYGKYGSNRIPVTKQYAIDVLLPAYKNQARSLEFQGKMADQIAMSNLRKNYLIIEEFI